jgi:hypothetical protein
MRHLRNNGPVEINFEEIDAELEKIGRPEHYRTIKWTPKMDEILLKYWPIRNKQDVANALGICDTTCLRRYRKLIGK